MPYRDLGGNKKTSRLVREVKNSYGWDGGIRTPECQDVMLSIPSVPSLDIILVEGRNLVLMVLVVKGLITQT